MTDYISREAVLEFVEPDARPFLAERIKSIPAADVRPVVYCKDCKYYRQSNFVDKHMECVRSGFPVHSVDFCSYGEKREES